MVPPRVSISGFVGTIKGRTAQTEIKSPWGNHIRAREYCVDTVGRDTEMIRTGIKYQEIKQEQRKGHNISGYQLEDNSLLPPKGAKQLQPLAEFKSKPHSGICRSLELQ